MERGTLLVCPPNLVQPDSLYAELEMLAVVAAVARKWAGGTLRRSELPELLHPAIERLLRHLQLAADLHDGRAALGLPQRLGDLLWAVLAGPHMLSSAPSGGSWPATIVPPFCESRWSRIRGADQSTMDKMSTSHFV